MKQRTMGNSFSLSTGFLCDGPTFDAEDNKRALYTHRHGPGFG